MNQFVRTAFSGFSAGALAICCVTATAAPRPVLVPTQPIALPDAAGHFDFMAVDSTRNRLLAAHKGTKSLTVLNLATHKIKSVPVGEAQGIAIGQNVHMYFAGTEGEHQVVSVNAKTLRKIKVADVDGPVDAIAYDSKNRRIYAAQDEGHHLWVIDARKMKVVGQIPIPGKPEDLHYDSLTNRIYLNIKDANLVALINPITNKVEKTWSTLPATSPHGMAIDNHWKRIYVAGRNGELVALDLISGKRLAEAKIANGVDLIGYDTKSHVLYSACRGYISVTQISRFGLKSLGDVPSHAGAHSLAVDSNRHTVWVSYADKDHSYVQEFKSKL